MKTRLGAFFERMSKIYEEDGLFHDTEVQANELIVRVLIANAIIIVLILVAVIAGVFPVSGLILPRLGTALVEILILGAISYKVKQDAWWLKYVLLLGLMTVYAQLDSLLTHKVAILMVIPVLCSSRYFSRILTIAMAGLSTVVFFVSGFLGAYFGWINMNDVRLPVGTTFTDKGIWLGSGIEETLDRAQYARDTLLFSYVPKLLMFSIAAVVAAEIARRGREMVHEQKELSESSARLETELKMAEQIQEGVLPNIYPPFPDRREFDIYATMNAAREVGGDFYDFFLVDDDHLALVVADVSGKGVPAALFMMASKIILANNAMVGMSPAKVLEATNSSVCSNNPQEMFVTVWFGILEISSGILTAANAGHEYPVLKQGERFELLKDRHGLVIGAFDGIKYKEYQIQLHPGDKLFLYSDGVPEATAPDLQLFGTERMLEALNQDPEGAPRAILSNVQHAVDKFVGVAEQFDDLTMLCLSYK